MTDLDQSEPPLMRLDHGVTPCRWTDKEALAVTDLAFQT
jgi:hypothetical protein